MNSFKNKLSKFTMINWVYIKYQVLAKSLLFLLIFPIYKLVSNTLIASTGRSSISSGDYLSFLFSFQGVGFLIASLLVLTILIGVDINAFIILSSLIKEKKGNLTARQLLLVGIKSLKAFLNPKGLLVMLYIAIIVPIVGVGVSVSVTKGFKIPNFITGVIFNNNLYLSIYVCALILLTIITLMHIFFFQYLLINKDDIGSALRNSRKLMKRHWKAFIKQFFLKSALLFVIIIAISLGITVALFVYTQNIEDILAQRVSSIFVSLTISEIIAYISFMTVPLVCYKITSLFYNFNKEDGVEISYSENINVKEKVKSFKILKRLSFVVSIILILLFNFVTSLIFGLLFDELFKSSKSIELIAHRGGGNLAAENSLLGMKEAAKHGAKWSEIDIQRTKDGYYVINHDNTFSRLSGSDKKSSEMTLSEIKKLKIKDLFNSGNASQPVSTLDEFLDSAKDNIGLFIELKGATADEKMVDDVVKMVKKKGMKNQVALLSLDYKIIEYIESKYPEIDSGYLYFFSIGDTKNLKADILIMEESEATEEKIQSIKKNGKKAIVWTVNTKESIEKFVSSDVDGIITDFLDDVKKEMNNQKNKTDIEIMVENIL